VAGQYVFLPVLAAVLIAQFMVQKCACMNVHCWVLVDTAPTGCADSCVCLSGVQELTGKYAHGKIAPCNYQLQVRLLGTVLALLPACVLNQGTSVSNAGLSVVVLLVLRNRATVVTLPAVVLLECTLL
jgi:hypothetical protein